MAFDSDDAKLGAGVLGIVTILWRLFYKGKKDVRDDKADGTIDGGYGKLISLLEKTVESQGAKIDDQDRFIHALGERLDLETERRRECERKNHAFELRIDHLETEVRRLGGGV